MSTPRMVASRGAARTAAVQGARGKLGDHGSRGEG
jgi:hypothetical protein